MEYVHSDLLPKAIGPYSPAVVHNGLLYSSGQIPLTVDGVLVKNEIKAQTRQVLTNIKNLLESREGSLSNVLKITIYLADMKDFPVLNVIFAEFFGDHKPARSTVEVSKLPMDALVEMDIIATLSDYH